MQILDETDRFLSYVQEHETYFGECWNWIGSINNQGYGQFRYLGTTVTAHRYSYEYFRGNIPDGKQIDHLCRNRACVNPDHLEAVTRKENIRRSKPVNCKRGHPLSGDNVYISPKSGSRRCQTCQKNWERLHRSKSALIVSD